MIRRRTPLKRTPLRSRAARNPGFSRQTKNDALRRCHGRCEAEASPQCRGVVEHFHHRRLRSQGGPNTLDNCLACCSACHAFIHRFPRTAAEHGWILRGFLARREDR